MEAPQSGDSSDDDFVKSAFTVVPKKASRVQSKTSDKTVPQKKQGKISTFWQELRSNTDYFFRILPAKKISAPKQITTTISSSSSSSRPATVEPGIWAPYGPAGADPDILPGNLFNK